MGGIGQVLKGILNWSPTGSPEWARQQQVQLSKQQQELEQQQQDMAASHQQHEDIQHALSMGAKYVGPGGMIREDVPLNAPQMQTPDTQGGEDNPTSGVSQTLLQSMQPGQQSGTTTIYRPPAKDEYVATYPGRKGEDPIKLAWPSTLSQMLSSQMAGEQAKTQGEAQGTAAGRTQGAINDLATRGVALPDDLATRYNLPKGIKLLPEQLATLSEKTIPSVIREEGANQRTAATNQTRQSIADANRSATQDRLNQTLAWKTSDAQNQLAMKDAVSQRSAAVQAGMSPNLAPVKLRAFTNQVAPLQATADIHRQAIDQALPLLDEKQTPDGTQFKNPFTGMDMEMNPGVRQMLGDRVGLATQRVDELHQQMQGLVGGGPQTPQKLNSDGSTTPVQGAPAGAPQASGPQGQPGAPAKPLTPIQADAQDILNHRMSPSQWLSQIGGRGMQKTARTDAVKAELRRLDPNFNWQDAESSYRLVNSPGFQQTIRYMDYAGSTLDNLVKNADALNNGNVRSVNQLINAGKDQFNNIDLKKFRIDQVESADAIAKILQGGGSGSGTSDAKLKQASDLIRDSDSPGAVSAAANEIRTLLGNRRTTLTRGTAMEGSAPAAPAPTPTGGKGAIAVKAPNGKTYTFKSQADADAFKAKAGIQ